MTDRQGTGPVPPLNRAVEEMAGDVESFGSLRRQEAELSSHLGDYGVVMAMDHVTNGEWLPRAMRFKLAQFFTSWAVLAITRLADPSPQSTSIPVLLKRLRRLQQRGEMRRDRWIERIAGIRDWRQAKEAEERERHELLIERGGGPMWFTVGAGDRAARLNEVWNLTTGREPGCDGHDDPMENWVLASAAQPLNCRQVRELLSWRNWHIAHQAMEHTRAGSSGYEVYPMRQLLRAYWAVMKAMDRTLLLAEGFGLPGLYPTPQFSVAHELTGGKIAEGHVTAIDEKLMTHSETWNRLLAKAEERWYDDLRKERRRRRQRRQ